MNTPARTLLALLALACGALAAVARSPEPLPAADEITAVELAHWIRERRPGLTLLDTRSAEAIARDRLPGARTAVDFRPDATRAGDTVVVYADRQVDQATVEALRRRGTSQRILRLRGGVQAWSDEVLFPTIRDDASRKQQRAFVPRAELSRYFGGSPRVLEPGAAPSRSRSRRGC